MNRPAHSAESPNLFLRAERRTSAKVYDVEVRPRFIVESASGAWLQDTEEHVLLDMTSANGTILLGYRDREVTDALVRQITDYGAMFPTTLTRRRIELAERLCTRYPAGEKAVFFRTGSDGTTAAIRMARAATRRRYILSSGYHGWHDWHLRFGQMGLDPRTDIIHFGYSLEALEHLLTKMGGVVGGVIVTPELGWHSLEHYQKMSTCCAWYGVPFMMDEVMSGLRYGPQGVNGSGEIPADLIIISKGLANGHALSAVIGSRELIDAYDAAHLAGTYNKEVTSMAAALKVLDILDDRPIHAQAIEAGRGIMAGIQAASERHGVDVWVTGPPLAFKTVFADDEVAAAITAACFRESILFEAGGTHMINHAFGENEIKYAVEAISQAMKIVSGQHDHNAGTPVNDTRRAGFATAAFGMTAPGVDACAIIDRSLRDSGLRLS